MTTSELINSVLIVFRRLPVDPNGPLCCLCNKRTQRKAVVGAADMDLHIEFHCHGAVERLTIERERLKRCFDVTDVLDLLPDRVFWPGFSRYSTTTKPPRRVL